MKHFVLMALVALMIMACNSRGVELYVSASASVDGDGSKENPYANLVNAMEGAEEIRKSDAKSLITINILPGEYFLDEPINITPALNNLKIIGADADKVQIKGAVKLETKWKPSVNEIVTTQVPEGLTFDQLCVNGKAQILARYPNYDEDAHYWQGFAADAISKERVASWKKPEGALFHALHGGRWGGFHWRIIGVNKDGTAQLEGGHQNNRASSPHKEYRMVENVLEELDSPGEWYLDTDENKLYYWPALGVDLKTDVFEVAVLKELIQVLGSLDNPVKNVSISGIKFSNTRRTLFEKYEPLLRSDWKMYRGSAMFFEGTENCTIEDCEFTNLGGNVIMASKYNKDLHVVRNHIHECGASAVSFIGDASAVRSASFNYGQFVSLEEMDTIRGPKNDLYPRKCTVDNNLIYRIGRIEKQSAGVQIAMAMDITVSHNSIYDVPRAGINIGDGTWGGHILEYNDVFNTVLETSDHGSFNAWGRDRFWHPNRNTMDSITTANPDMPRWDAIHTTIIRNNRFRCDHGWDIDLDDGSSNYHIYNNLCLASGIKLREGFFRVVENNITVNNSIHPHVWFANSQDVIRKNILMDAYQDVGLLGWGKELDFNLFPNEEALMKSQIYNRDMNSTFGDPLFEHPSQLDFKVAENSPAISLGFVNFPMDNFGVQKAELKLIAKTPEVPEIKKDSKGSKASSPKVAWLRNNLKSIDSEQEQSAYGLNTADGVIVLSVWKHSPAVLNNGLKRGDVILEVEGLKVKNAVEFLKVTRKYQESGSINVVVMRNQIQRKLRLNIK